MLALVAGSHEATPAHRHRGWPGQARSSHAGFGTGSLAVDGDAADRLLHLLGLRQGHGEDAVLERRRDLVLVDALERDAALEPAVAALAEQPILVLDLGLLLAPDR
jgi:hypothetical protein